MDYLKMAADELYAAHQEAGIGPLESRMLRVIGGLISHLESQNQTAAAEETSEPSYARMTGPVVRRYGSAIASLDTSRAPYLLMVETGGSIRSISCTWEELTAIRQLCSIPPSTYEWPTPSGSSRDGSRGPAGHERN